MIGDQDYREIPKAERVSEHKASKITLESVRPSPQGKLKYLPRSACALFIEKEILCSLKITPSRSHSLATI